MPRKTRKPQDTVKKAQKMIAAFADTCNVVEAAKKAGVPRRTHYNWLRRYPKYAAAFEKTKLAAAEYMESEAVQRASKGWLEPVYYQGKVCGKVRRFSDGLMQFLLRGLMPEKYGINRTEVAGPQGGPMQAKIEVVFVKPGEDSSQMLK